MLTFKEFLSEGGNIKIGEHQAGVIDVTSRTRQSAVDDISNGLHELHKSFHKAHGEHLFGDDARALRTGTAYSGSTSHLMDTSIPHEELTKHKKSFGDVDVKVPREHMDKLYTHLQPGLKFGKYTVLGVSKSGGEHHLLAKHENGQNHQFDFEPSTYEKGEPSHFDRLSHSSNWDDVKSGFKGFHHKVLMNAVGGDTHKFSILHGIGKREGDADWEKDPHKMSKRLFGPKATGEAVQSFKSLTSAIKKHVPRERHQAILDKFKTSAATNKGVDSAAAIAHLQNELGLK